MLDASKNTVIATSVSAVALNGLTFATLGAFYLNPRRSLLMKAVLIGAVISIVGSVLLFVLPMVGYWNRTNVGLQQDSESLSVDGNDDFSTSTQAVIGDLNKGPLVATLTPETTASRVNEPLKFTLTFSEPVDSAPVPGEFVPIGPQSILRHDERSFQIIVVPPHIMSGFSLVLEKSNSVRTSVSRKKTERQTEADAQVNILPFSPLRVTISCPEPLIEAGSNGTFILRSNNDLIVPPAVSDFSVEDVDVTQAFPNDKKTWIITVMSSAIPPPPFSDFKICLEANGAICDEHDQGVDSPVMTSNGLSVLTSNLSMSFISCSQSKLSISENEDWVGRLVFSNPVVAFQPEMVMFSSAKGVKLVHFEELERNRIFDIRLRFVEVGSRQIVKLTLPFEVTDGIHQPLPIGTHSSSVEISVSPSVPLDLLRFGSGKTWDLHSTVINVDNSTSLLPVDILTFANSSHMELNKNLNFRLGHIVGCTTDGNKITAVWARSHARMGCGFIDPQIKALRENNQDVSLQFGGQNAGVSESSQLHERVLASCTRDPTELAAAYLRAITVYDAQRIEFDLYGESLTDVQSNQTRNDALVLLRNQTLMLGRKVDISFIVSSRPEGQSCIMSALSKGVNVRQVNVRVPIGSSGVTELINLHDFLSHILPDAHVNLVWRMCGVLVDRKTQSIDQINELQDFLKDKVIGSVGLASLSVENQEDLRLLERMQTLVGTNMNLISEHQMNFVGEIHRVEAVAVTPKGVLLEWDFGIHTTGFDIWRNDKCIVRLQDVTLPRFEDLTVFPGKSYQYRISGWNSKTGATGPKSTCSTHVMTPLLAPRLMIGNITTLDITDHSVHFSWFLMDPLVERCEIKIRRNNVEIATLAPGTRHFFDERLNASSVYNYKFVFGVLGVFSSVQKTVFTETRPTDVEIWDSAFVFTEPLERTRVWGGSQFADFITTQGTTGDYPPSSPRTWRQITGFDVALDWRTGQWKKGSLCSDSEGNIFRARWDNSSPTTSAAWIKE